MIEESLQLALDSAPFLLKGAYYTVFLSIGGMFFGLLLGFGLAFVQHICELPVDQGNGIIQSLPAGVKQVVLGVDLGKIILDLCFCLTGRFNFQFRL